MFLYHLIGRSYATILRAVRAHSDRSRQLSSAPADPGPAALPIMSFCQIVPDTPQSNLLASEGSPSYDQMTVTGLADLPVAAVAGRDG